MDVEEDEDVGNLERYIEEGQAEAEAEINEQIREQEALKQEDDKVYINEEFNPAGIYNSDYKRRKEEES